MGSIATIAPIAYTLCQKLHLDAALCMGTVVGGAMFGDSLSPISDTTIAAVASQNANPEKRLRLNAGIAAIAGGITLICLYFMQPSAFAPFPLQPYDAWLITPYIVLLSLSFSGRNVFVTLCVGLAWACGIAYLRCGIAALQVSQWMNAGFASMQEIMLLSLLVGGLFGLSGKTFVAHVHQYIVQVIQRYRLGSKATQFLIGGLVAVCDLFLANNTIAIIFTWPVVAPIASMKGIPSHYTATWLNIFSWSCKGLFLTVRSYYWQAQSRVFLL